MSNMGKAQEVAAQVRRVFKSNEIVTFLTSTALDVDVIETGIPSLDLALGVGGVPRGRVVEIFGPEGGGKTSTCLSICAQAQAAGGVAAFIDVEHALDPTWARKLDVDLDNLILSQPNSGEEALSLLQVLSGSEEVDVIIVDSVAAISPMAESTDDVTNIASGGIGLQARLMSSSLRKLCATIGQSPSCVIFTNQVREKIGVMYGCFHGDSGVMLADGSSLPIRTIVNNQIPVDVLCWDHSENKVVSAPVIDWHRNGTAEQFIKFTVSDNTGTVRQRFLCTDHHIIPTPSGERRAEDLEVGDDVFFLNEKVLSDKIQSRPVGSILSKEIVTDKPSMQRFDITVQDHANYFVNGVNVHNSPETTPGGRALKFYSSVRIRTSSSSSASKLIGAKDNPTGQMISFKIVKNKVAPPFKTAEAIISFERGWDKEEGLVTTLIALGIAKRAGAYYDLIGERFQGRSAIVDYMREDPLFCEEARSLLLAQGKAPMVGEEVVDESEDIREEEE